MKEKIISKLNELNHQFYELSGVDFSATRNFSWQGWNQLLPFFKRKVANRYPHILDLGCGNGRLLEFLQIHLGQKFTYLGLDSSKSLLEIAKNKYDEYHFQHFDLIQKYLNYGKIILPSAEKFDLIVLFGLTHHLPSLTLRQQLFSDLKKYLNKDGLLIVSNWQFAAEPDRFLKNTLTLSKIWQNQKIKLSDKLKLFFLWLNLEKNDYILDWRKGQHADLVFRYCHFLAEEEMQNLSKEAGLEIISTFNADGKSSKLNQYFVLQYVALQKDRVRNIIKPS